MQHEHANKETRLISKHTEELRRAELHAETELREVSCLYNILNHHQYKKDWYYVFNYMCPAENKIA